MTKDLHAIRGIDEETYRRFRERAVRERMKVGEALNFAMKHWIREEKGKLHPNPKNLIKLHGLVKTTKKVRWSENIDEFLYGRNL